MTSITLYFDMVRYRPRAQALKAIKDINNHRQQQKSLRNVIFDSDDDSGIDSDDSLGNDEELLLLEDLKDQQYLDIQSFIESHRYLVRNSSYRNRTDNFNLNDIISYNSGRFNDDEFVGHFRVCRSTYHWLCSIFANNQHLVCKSNHVMKPIELHVLLFLKKVGSEGTSGSDSKLADFFGIGKGTVPLMFSRMKNAILSLKDKVITWPTQAQKERMKLEIKTKYGFQKCVGIIDGTIIILQNRPVKYGDSYYCRKNVYALNVQVVCDQKCNVLYYYGGWPGSVHDNRAWKNCKLYKNQSTFFDTGEYLVGDCAYSACNVMVQTFKKLPGISNLSKEEEFFNNKLGSLRVKSEHCIGILKNRFPMLRRTNVKIVSQKDVMHMMDIFGCCCILHNLLLEVGEEIPIEWLREVDSGHYWTSDYDASEVGHDLESDRRDEVFKAYLEDYYVN